MGKDKTAEMSEPVLEKIAAGDKSAVDDCLSRFGGLIWSLTKRNCVAGGEAEDAEVCSLWKHRRVCGST